MSHFTLGIDIGSTTAKFVLMDKGKVIYQKYQRHLSQVRQTTLAMLKELQKEVSAEKVKVTISGSASRRAQCDRLHQL